MYHMFLFLFILFGSTLTFDDYDPNLMQTVTKDFILYEPSIEYLSNLTKIKQNFSSTSINPLLVIKSTVGDNVMIKCHLNSTNKEKSQLDQTIWFKYPSQPNQKFSLLNPKLVKLNYILERSFLFIRNFDTEDTGIYFCLHLTSLPNLKIQYINSTDDVLELLDEEISNYVNKEKFFRLEYLIVEYQKNIKVNLYTSDKTSLHIKNKISFEKLKDPSGLNIFTYWGNWSICRGSCDSSKKLFLTTRRGYCRVEYDSKIQTNLLFNRLNEYFGQNGWSCYYSIHYQFLSVNTLTKDIFHDYIEYKTCNLSCSNNRETETMDEEINHMFAHQTKKEKDRRKNFREFNLEDVYEKPRFSIVRLKGESIQIRCLDYNLGFDVNLLWKKNGDSIDKKLLNSLNEIEIKKLKYSDSGTYECFLNTKLVVTIDLKINSKAKKDYSSIRLNIEEYNSYNELIYKLIAFLTILILIQLFFNLLNDHMVRKKLVEAKKKSNNISDLNKFLKINIQYFENKFFNKIPNEDDVDKNESSDSDENEDSLMSSRFRPVRRKFE
ncbi:unnamed protein product [Brachionus calyciflorus]|uniref:Ig-like domain-containing protein n=1 Tax=Brachionus calyciflorus TaxID=104777 RepID=A0A813MA91_9BILA|nr:unnamed protein product [Brachionus calyciflorus]